MKSYQEAVKEFMRAFGQTTPEKPDLENYPFALRSDLITEEAHEFARACDAKDPVAMLDAICDLLYVVHGASIAMGVNIDPFFWEVHSSNMSKLNPETGKPIYRDDGKVLKSSAYRPPDLYKIYKSIA